MIQSPSELIRHPGPLPEVNGYSNAMLIAWFVNSENEELINVIPLHVGSLPGETLRYGWVKEYGLEVSPRVRCTWYAFLTTLKEPCNSAH